MAFPDVNWTDPTMPGREMRAIRIEAETEAQNLLFGLAHYAHAQAAIAHYGPAYGEQRTRLARLEAEHMQMFSAWLEAKAAANTASEARATKARETAAELAKQLRALDKTLEPLRLEVQHAAVFLASLSAVEQPALPLWFVEAVRKAIRGTGPLRL